MYDVTSERLPPQTKKQNFWTPQQIERRDIFASVRFIFRFAYSRSYTTKQN